MALFSLSKKSSRRLTQRLVNSNRVLFCSEFLECYTRLKYRNIARVVTLVYGLLAVRGLNDKSNQLFELSFKSIACCDAARVEIYPVLLACRKIGVCGDLDGRHKASERSAAACCKQYHMAACACKVGYSYHIVSGAVEQVQTMARKRVAIKQNVAYLTGSRLLSAAQRLVLKRCDTARLVSGRGVLINGLIMLLIIFFKAVDQFYDLVEGKLPLSSLKVICI